MREFLRGLFYLFLGAFGGYLSAVAAIDSFGALPAGAGGQWQYRDVDPSSAAHPYALAHYLLPGRFPPPSGHIMEFTADRDKDGNTIDGDCVYSVKGTPPAAGWWSIAIPEDGAIANPAITAETAILDPGGQLTITISRYPATGNWLMPATGDNYSLIYAVSESRRASETIPAPPFIVARTGC